jgi:hypothetical protein
MRKLFSLLEVVVLVYLTIVLIYTPEKFWWQGIWIYIVFGVTEIVYFSSEFKNKIKPGNSFLIETRITYTSFDNLLVACLIILFVTFAIKQWDILKYDQVQLVWFSLVVGLKYNFYARQKRCVMVDNEKISFSEIFQSDLYFSEIESCRIDMKKYTIHIKLRDNRKLFLRIKEDFMNENIEEIKRVLKIRETNDQDKKF